MSQKISTNVAALVASLIPIPADDASKARAAAAMAEAKVAEHNRMRNMLQIPPEEQSIDKLQADISNAKSVVTNLSAAISSVEALMPNDGQVKTSALYGLMCIQRDIESLSSAISHMIDRHKYEISRHCIDRDEPLSGISDANLSITVKDDIRFSCDPQKWDLLPKKFFQKRVLESALSSGFEANDKEVVDLVADQIVKTAPYIRVDVRRKPGR